MELIETYALRLQNARETGQSAEVLDASLDYAGALKVQEIVQSSLGSVAGFKVARRTDGPPILAPIPTSRTFESGARVQIGQSEGIELEIGFEVIRPLDDGALDQPQKYFRPRTVIELVKSRWRGEGATPIQKMADMQLNDGLVIGPAFENWTGEDFTAVPAQVSVNGVLETDKVVALPGGSALGSLALCIDHLGDHCGGLQVGQIVITGSLNGLPYFPAGTEIVGTIWGQGSVSCHLITG